MRTANTGSTEETAADARSDALAACSRAGFYDGEGCRWEYTFTNCSAAASAIGYYLGFATGNDLESAQMAALAQCRELGGDSWAGPPGDVLSDVRCEIESLSNRCVDPITPQTRQFVRGYRNTRYGAVATYDVPLGGIGRYYDIEYNHTTTEAAREFACQLRSNCRDVTIFTACAARVKDGSIYATRGSDEAATFVGVSFGNTAAEAESKALAACRSGSSGRSSRCEIDGPFNNGRQTAYCNFPITPHRSN